LLFNEIKSATTQSVYNKAIEYNNNFFIIGAGIKDTNENNENFSFNSLVVKTNSCGKVLWKYFYGKIGNFNNTFYDIILHSNYLYLLGGTEEEANTGTASVTKIDLDGNLVWSKIYSKFDNDILAANFFIENNQIIIYGSREFGSKSNIYIMKIDTAGNLIKDYDLFINNGITHLQRAFKIDSYYLGIASTDLDFKYGKDNIIYNSGLMLIKFDTNFNIIQTDTIKRNYRSKNKTIDYNPKLMKFIIALDNFVSSDSTHRQIAFLDSAGHLEKIIEDPYSPIYYPKNLIAYQDGWVANWDGGLVKFSADYKKEKNIVFGRIDTGYFVSNNTSVVRNGTALLVTGGCKGCNPFDDNTDGKYERPTAIMIDSNFKDFGKAQPPIEAPKPFAAIKAFPNPALESITLQITETEAVYSIYNSMGMFVSAGSMQSSTDISLLNMASGMYIIQLKSPQGNYIGNVKFLKK